MNAMPSSLGNSCNPRRIELVGLSAERAHIPTGMKDEFLLLSWLIVLLRTKEDRRASYHWMYQIREPETERELASGYLSTDEVMDTLKSSVRQITASISTYMAGAISRSHETFSSPISLILSTGCQPKAANESKNEVGV